MGGTKSGFQKTHWSMIRSVKTHNENRRRAIVDGLIREYWKPVYCYLMHKGYSNEDAKDLTQGFFYEIVLGRDIIQQADESKGRFRTFLLTALNHYVTSVHRAMLAGKRHPKDGILSLEEFDQESVSLTARSMKPDDIFTYVWASMLMDDVIAEVKEGCVRDGKKIHWEIFRSRILDPILAGTEPISVSELCKRYDLKNDSKVSNMIVTVKRRMQMAMAGRVRQYVDSDEQVNQEIQDIIKILSRNCAR